MKHTLDLTLKLMFLALMFVFISCGNDDDKKEDDVPDDNPALVTNAEKSDLLQLREEEKLARDVYLYAYNKYGSNIFVNISSSEQTHMDRVLIILNTYKLEDPVDSIVGVFNDDALQNLYNQLVAQVDLSLLDALKVGATIEDLDIYDIAEFQERTEKSDILSMYESLKCGSRNHLRSFYSNIVRNGGSYSPQYISQSYYESVINGENETCN